MQIKNFQTNKLESKNCTEIWSLHHRGNYFTCLQGHIFVYLRLCTVVTTFHQWKCTEKQTKKFFLNEKFIQISFCSHLKSKWIQFLLWCEQHAGDLKELPVNFDQIIPLIFKSFSITIRNTCTKNGTIFRIVSQYKFTNIILLPVY